MFRFKVVYLALFCALIFALTSCTGGSNMPGSISGKFSDAGGTIKANRATLYIPPFAVSVTDEGFDDLKDSEKNFEYFFTLTESILQPAGFIDGSVYSLLAVSEFQAEIKAPLTLTFDYSGLPIPAGASPSNLTVAHYDVTTDIITDIASSYNPDTNRIQAPIMMLGVYFLKVAS